MSKITMMVCCVLVLALGLALPVVGAERQTAGDLLLIEKVRERMSRDLPDNGLTMAEVELRFGPPLNRRGPIGDPPISHWAYADFSVYFEHQLVIESVLHPEAVIRESHSGR